MGINRPNKTNNNGMNYSEQDYALSSQLDKLTPEATDVGLYPQANNEGGFDFVEVPGASSEEIEVAVGAYLLSNPIGITDEEESTAIYLDDYSPDKTGTTDSSQAFIDAFDAASLTDEKRVIVREGTYYITSTIVTNDSMNVICEDNVVIRRGPDILRAFEFNYLSSDTANVTDINVLGGQRTELTLDDVSALAIGDIIKIHSDDLYGSRTLTGSKFGEHVEVLDIVGSIVKVSSDLKNDYQTNVKIVRLSDEKVTWVGGELTDEDNPSSYTASIIQVNGGKYHQFTDISTNDCHESGLRFRGCYGYKVEADFYYHRDKTVLGGTYVGYGIVDSTGSNYEIKLKSSKTRHAFTTGSDTGSYPEFYGLSEDGIIIASKSNEDTTAAFDTHDEAENIVFQDCEALNSSLYGFQLRGTGHELNNCKAYGYNGLSFLNITESDGVYTINDCVVDVESIALAINQDTTFGGELVFNRCIIKGYSVNASDATLVFNDCELTLDRFYGFGEIDVTFNRCNLNVSTYFRTDNANSRIEFNDCDIYTGYFRILSSANIIFNRSSFSTFGNMFKIESTGGVVNLTFNEAVFTTSGYYCGMIEFLAGANREELNMIGSLEIVNTNDSATPTYLVIFRALEDYTSLTVRSELEPLILREDFNGYFREYRNFTYGDATDEEIELMLRNNIVIKSEADNTQPLLKPPSDDKEYVMKNGIWVESSGGVVGAWGDYTPTISWGTAIPVNTVTIAKYTQIGNTVKVLIRVSSADGNGVLGVCDISLPVAPKTNSVNPPVLVMQKVNSIVSTKYGVVIDDGINDSIEIILDEASSGSSLDVSISVEYEVE